MDPPRCLRARFLAVGDCKPIGVESAFSRVRDFCTHSACLLPSASRCVAHTLLAPPCLCFARVLPRPCISSEPSSHAVSPRVVSLACSRPTFGPNAEPSSGRSSSVAHQIVSFSHHELSVLLQALVCPPLFRSFLEESGTLAELLSDSSSATSDVAPAVMPAVVDVVASAPASVDDTIAMSIAERIQAALHTAHGQPAYRARLHQCARLLPCVRKWCLRALNTDHDAAPSTTTIWLAMVDSLAVELARALADGEAMRGSCTRQREDRVPPVVASAHRLQAPLPVSMHRTSPASIAVIATTAAAVGAASKSGPCAAAFTVCAVAVSALACRRRQRLLDQRWHRQPSTVSSDDGSGIPCAIPVLPKTPEVVDDEGVSEHLLDPCWTLLADARRLLHRVKQVEAISRGVCVCVYVCCVLCAVCCVLCAVCCVCVYVCMCSLLHCVVVFPCLAVSVVACCHRSSTSSPGCACCLSPHQATRARAGCHL